MSVITEPTKMYLNVPGVKQVWINGAHIVATLEDGTYKEVRTNKPHSVELCDNWYDAKHMAVMQAIYNLEEKLTDLIING